jgi:hypothetical protein
MDLTHRLGAITGTLGVLSLSAVHAAPALPNPCALLTAKEISGVVGPTFGASSAIGATGCSWTAPTGKGSPNVTVTLVVQDASLWAKATAPLPGIARVPESGIGDAAIYTIAGPYASLGVRKGAVTVIIRMYGVHDLAKQKTLEKSLAADAIAKL